jgi:hypothetical protein
MPALRLEILGCFEAYVTEEMIVQTTITPPIRQKNCSVCPGITNIECDCSSDTWWNGESCGLRSECPCVLGIMTYQVGTVYDLENCQQCTCTLGGLPDCVPKNCATCPPVSNNVYSFFFFFFNRNNIFYLIPYKCLGRSFYHSGIEL